MPEDGVSMERYPAVNLVPKAGEPSHRRGLGVVVHSFWNRWQAHHAGVYPSPLDVAKVAADLGFEGIQTLVSGWQHGEAKAVRAFLDVRQMWLEGSIEVPRSIEDLERFRHDLRQGVMAGATFFRCYLGWRRYDEHLSLEHVEKYIARVSESLRLAEPELVKVGARLAVENHKDLRACEVAGLLEGLQSGAVGCCLDLANNLALLEPAEETLEILATHLMAVHLKDVVVAPTVDGFAMAEVPLGLGVLDLPGLISRCREVAPAVAFSLEMITRAPLAIPCRTERYRSTMPPEEMGSRLEAMMEWVSSHAGELPSVAGLSETALCDLESAQNESCLRYARTHLGF